MPSGVSCWSTRQPAAAAAQFEIGHCLTLLGSRGSHGGVPEGPERLPESPWAAQALERNDGAISDFTKAVGLPSGSTAALRSGPATPSRTCGHPDDARAHAVDRVRQVERRGLLRRRRPSLRQPGGQDLSGLSLTPGNEIVVAARAPCASARATSERSPSPGTSRVAASHSRRSRRPRPAGRRDAGGRRETQAGAPFRGRAPGYQGTSRTGGSGRCGASSAIPRRHRAARPGREVGAGLRRAWPCHPDARTERTRLRAAPPVDVAVDHSRNLYVADEELACCCSPRRPAAHDDRRRGGAQAAGAHARAGRRPARLLRQDPEILRYR